MATKNPEHEHDIDTSFNDKPKDVYQVESPDINIVAPPKARLWPIFASGAGLLADGYLQNVVGVVNTCFIKLYSDYKGSSAQKNIGSIAFAGIVIGQLFWGFTSDKYSRKWSLMISTFIMFVFAALGAGAYGAGGSTSGLFAALTAYRFLLGIGLGGEYPCASVMSAESSAEMKEGTRNRWFALATNTQIDIGFVMGALIPMIIAAATTNLEIIWRLSLAIGTIIPFTFLFLRARLDEPPAYKRNKKAKIPYLLGLKYYGLRLARVAIIWFVYDFLTYPFSLYSTQWINTIQPDQSLWQTFGWGALVNFFYVPGAVLGAFTSDWMGPRLALIVFLAVQGVIGFIMAGCYYYLGMAQNIGGFVVIYGLFLAVGEMGPGDNIGLVASKTVSTPIRGMYYGIAAAVGKIGGFVGNYVFPTIIADAGDDLVKQGQYPFWVECALIFVAAGVAFTLPHIGQDSVEKEDADFNAYLEKNGWVWETED